MVSLMKIVKITDVAIIGGGPAGLSAALILGRCCRQVILFDHDKPRNYAARQLNGYLGLENCSPRELRARGRQQALSYGAEIVSAEVLSAHTNPTDHGRFTIITADGPPRHARKLLLATGTLDVLPEIENLRDLYGKGVYHCPYCDGWEHRHGHLVALGDGPAPVGLALALRNWSELITVCTQGQELSPAQQAFLQERKLGYRPDKVAQVQSGPNGFLNLVVFENGPSLACDALFFASEQRQRSRLPELLGCDCDPDGLIRSHKKQTTNIPGLYIAGDADGDVQFAIVAAAEGATAAAAINRELQDEDYGVLEP
ncbi:MAG: NAD(P)/FAD-dependent oxidoreductase [Pirellulales bacterium]|nr:NAD(P)/FAD-dependent oxidoreductase [Pirellulales bacterium]